MRIETGLGEIGTFKYYLRTAEFQIDLSNQIKEGQHGC